MALEYIILLYVTGFVLLIAEVFVPGGFLGVLGAIALAISIYFGFALQDYGLLVGLIQVALVLIILPLTFYFGLKRLSLSKSLNAEDGFLSAKEDLGKLINKEGVAFTNLRPAGTALIDGHKVDVVTEGGMIDKNIPVRVINVEGTRVVVRSK